jgi:CubicO group peptidase (beta-lactamase class C family)
VPSYLAKRLDEKNLNVRVFNYGDLAYPNPTGQRFQTKPLPVREDTVFDLASLTKPLATLLAILCLIKARKIKFSDSLPALLDQHIPTPLDKITLAQLLCHRSGLPAHRPYFLKLMNLPEETRFSTLKRWLLQEELEHNPGSKTLYSDLGYMMLGWVIEQQSGQKLNDFVTHSVLKPLNLTNQIFYITKDIPKTSIYAPTENCPWRKKTLAGQVHDDNCYALGGIAGHAGLFGNISGVLDLATHLLDTWNGKETHPNYSPHDLIKVTKKQYPDSTWALGFDTPANTNSSAGSLLSKQSFGHLGFTGTSFWISPSDQLVVVLLTNRVHPTRDNNLIRQFRPKFHDTILQWLNSNSKE